MANQSPQRTRKSQVQQPQQPQQQQQQQQQMHTGPAAGAGPNVRREASPSPSLRERQRYVRTQSMPIVSTQVHPSDLADAQGASAQPSAPSVAVATAAGAGAPQQPTQIGYPRPIPLSRVTQPQFPLHGGRNNGGQAEKWQMTDDLQAEIDRADLLQQQQQHQQQRQHSPVVPPPGPPPAPGTAGVAYAGGAASAGAAFVSHVKAHSSGNVTVSVGVGVGTETVDVQQQPARRRTTAAAVAAGEQAQHRASPLAYALRKTANTSPGYPSIPSPRSLKNRTPDRSLPVQEEPDEHDHQQQQQRRQSDSVSGPIPGRITPSPAPSSDLNPMNDLEHDAEGTLVDLGDDDDEETDRRHSQQQKQQQQRLNGESTESSGDGSHTPRSPNNALFPQSGGHHGNIQIHQVHGQRNIHELLQPDKPTNGVGKNGVGVGVGFDPADFQQTLKKLQSSETAAHNSSNYNANPNYNYNYNAIPAPAGPPSVPPPPFSPFSRNDYSRNESRGSYPNWMFDFYHNYPAAEEMEYFEYDEAAAAYMQQFAPTHHVAPGQGQGRPDAPVPPTPHSQTSAPTPFQNPQNENGNQVDDNDEEDEDIVNRPNNDNGVADHNTQSTQQRPFPGPAFSPAPPSGTPYPYPFSHVRRGFVYPPSAPPPPSIPRVPSSVYDPNVVQEQIRLQMQMYAYNNGAMTDSTISQASTPYPGVGPGYTPFGAFLNQTRAYARARELANANASGYAGEDGRLTSASIRSSPSHMPVPLPPSYTPGRGRGLDKRDRFAHLRGKTNGIVSGGGLGGRVQRRKPPPRVDSTQPRETSPEPSSGEETAGEKYEHEHREHVQQQQRVNGQEWSNGVRGEGEEEGEWVDEDSDEEEDLLDLEYHPTYVTNADRRRKRWEHRWDDLLRAFRALDRETDTTLMLFASPSHTDKLYSLSSRAVRRDASLFDGHAVHAARSAFESVASQRRKARNQHRASLLERLYASSSSAASQSGGDGEGNGSPGSGGGADAGDEDLRSMLRTALHSLGALHQVYEEREARWRMEERRMRDEREGVNLLIHQAFGEGMAMPAPPPAFPPPMMMP